MSTTTGGGGGKGGSSMLRVLEEELTSVTEGVEGWQNTFFMAARKSQAAHESGMARAAEEVKKIAHEKEALHQLERELENLFREQEAELERLKADMGKAREEEERWRENTAELQRVVEKLAERKEEEERDVSAVEREEERRSTALRRIVSKYENALGLSISAGPEGQLRLSFTKIHPLHPAGEFVAVLHVGPDRKYIVEQCTPPIANIDKLVRLVNETNDFSKFVWSIRKAFQHSVRS